VLLQLVVVIGERDDTEVWHGSRAVSDCGFGGHAGLDARHDQVGRSKVELAQRLLARGYSSDHDFPLAEDCSEGSNGHRGWIDEEKRGAHWFAETSTESRPSATVNGWSAAGRGICYAHAIARMAENNETRTGPPEATAVIDGVLSTSDPPPEPTVDDVDGEVSSCSEAPPAAGADRARATNDAAGEDIADGGESGPKSSDSSELAGAGGPPTPLDERSPPHPTLETRKERTFSGEIDAGWLVPSEPDVARSTGLAGVGAGIGRTLVAPGAGRGLPRPSQASKLAAARSSAAHAIDLPLIESRRPEASGPGSVDEAVELLEGANARTREALAALVRIVDEARDATEKSANATESMVDLLRNERRTRLVEAAQRVHSENEVAVLTEERDRLRRELADARADGQATAALTDQIRELKEHHAAELLRRQAALEAEHEQLHIQSEDRKRLNEELDELHQELAEKSLRVTDLETAAAEPGELAAKLEAAERERDELRRERDSAREQTARLQVEAEASRRATQLNVAEQKRLREELESQRRVAKEVQEEAARLQEQVAAGAAVDSNDVAAERDRLRAERDELQALKTQLESDLAADRRALETALVDREFVDAEVAEWRAKAEDEARRSGQLEAEQSEWRETQAQLEAKISELHEIREQLAARLAEPPEGELAADRDGASLPPGATRGLALPDDEATRDDLVERLLQAKQQIDNLLQERAQTRVKIRLLEAQAKQD
jgi:hypothetical protein